MNRVVVDKGVLSGTAGAQGTVVVRGAEGIDYLYDAAGRRVSSLREATLPTQHWVYTVNGQLAVPGTEGGDWELRNSTFRGDRREDYFYDDAGRLSQVRIAEATQNPGPKPEPNEYPGLPTQSPPPTTGQLKASYAYDAMGRITRQTDWWGNGVSAAYDRYDIVYNAKGQVTAEKVATRQLIDTYRSETTNDYGTGTAYALGAVVSTATTNYKNDLDDDSVAPDTSTSYSYAWRDGAVQSSISHDSDTGNNSNTLWTTSFTLNGLGVTTGIAINDGRAIQLQTPRQVTIVSDMNGQAIRRDEQDGASGGDPHEIWYRFAGRQLGYTGNNGTLETDYATSISNRTNRPPSNPGPFRFGATTHSSHAAFDPSLDQINSYAQGGAGGSYTVRTGDTLQSIAAAMWGDASLWYKLAEANGMGAHSALVAGQRLNLPAGVQKNTHNASTFRPYDPSEAIGDVNPTNPKIPKNNKCGVMGAVLLVAVAVAVSIVTAGAFAAVAASAATGSSFSLGAGIGMALGGSAAVGGTAATVGLTTFGMVAAGAIGGAVGSAVSQGLGVATGLQEKFSWKGVAMAGIGGGVGGAMGKVVDAAGVLAAGARGALGSAFTQGIGVTVGLQKKFDFVGVAAAAVGSMASVAYKGKMLGVRGEFAKNAAGYAMMGATSMVGAMANAATRTALSGTSFGDNLIAALPDVIGSTIGNAIGDAIAARSPARRAAADEMNGTGGPYEPISESPADAARVIPPFGDVPAAVEGDSPLWMLMDWLNQFESAPGWLERGGWIGPSELNEELAFALIDRTDLPRLQKFVLPLFERHYADTRMAEVADILREHVDYWNAIADRASADIARYGISPVGELADLYDTANDVRNGTASPWDVGQVIVEARFGLRRIRRGGEALDEAGDAYRAADRRLEQMERQRTLRRPRLSADVLRQMGDPPAGMVDPHRHHILEVNGRRGEHRELVREGQDILRSHGIDPLRGIENLVWAPNRGHTIGPARELVTELRSAQQLGAGRTEIVEILRRHGREAARR